MEEGFELPVKFGDRELMFPAQLLKMGYIYKIEVRVEGIPVIFERDEERNWRALTQTDQTNAKLPAPGLLQAIATSLEELL
jgi:hypothetical protein